MDASIAAKVKEIHAKYPGNRAIKYLHGLQEDGTVAKMSKAEAAHLLRCCNTGLENHDSDLGAYAMTPQDYDTLACFFDQVINDYHNNPAGDKVHVTSWELQGLDGIPADGKLDLSAMGVAEDLSMRVRVARNLAAFPLPGAMTKADRVTFEKTMLGAFAKLVADPAFGGKVSSLTPHAAWKEVTGEAENPNFIDDAQYKKMVDDHVLFKDMSNDSFLNAAGISGDWPCGRGCYQSADGGFIVWFGEEDHLRIIAMAHSKVLNTVFDRLHQALQVVESIEGIKFATSSKYGFVTSCPTNIGTGMRASVHLKLPKLTADGTDKQAKAAANVHNLSVRGMGGEHTPIGADGTVDISPRARLFVTEAQIVQNLYNGIKAVLAAEAAAPAK
jgi:creatine kinase